MVTVWSKRAKTELKKAYEYILQDSPQNAVKVRDEIIDITLNLPANPKCIRQISIKKKTTETGEPLKYIIIEYHIV